MMAKKKYFFLKLIETNYKWGCLIAFFLFRKLLFGIQDFEIIGILRP